MLWHVDNPFHRMFLNKRYEQASVALQKAGRNREAAVCQAYLLRGKARMITTTARAARIQAFLAAAEAFVDCVRDSTVGQERLGYHKAAGECYSEAHSYKKSGKNYCIAEEYDEAACAYLKGGYFDEMVEVINRNRDTMDGGLVERLEMAAKFHYFKVCFKTNPRLDVPEIL